MICNCKSSLGFFLFACPAWAAAGLEVPLAAPTGFGQRRLLQNSSMEHERSPFAVSGVTSTVFLVLAACLTCLIIFSLFFSYFCLRLRSSRRQLSSAGGSGHTSSDAESPIIPIPFIEVNPLHAIAAKGELASPKGSSPPPFDVHSKIVVVHPDNQVVIACHGCEEEGECGGRSASRRSSQELRGSHPYQGGASSRRSSFEEYLVQPYQNHLML